MLGKYAATYVLVFQTIDGLIDNMKQLERIEPVATSQLQKLIGAEAVSLPERARNSTKDTIKAMLESLATRMTFPSVEAQAKRVAEGVDKGEGPKEIGSKLSELRSRFLDELMSREFVYVPPELVAFYGLKSGFGDPVTTAFSSSTEDIEHAGNCLALGEPTAAVLHLMRALELALDALAAKLSIALAPKDTWGAKLNKIDPAIKALPESTAEEKQSKNRWSELRTSLWLLKEAWRDDSMHGKRTYTPEEGREIYQAARVFMTKMAALK